MHLLYVALRFRYVRQLVTLLYTQIQADPVQLGGTIAIANCLLDYLVQKRKMPIRLVQYLFVALDMQMQ